MQDELIALGLRAAELARRLVNEVGPRPAGSPAEQKALKQVQFHLAALGYTFQTQEFDFPPLPAFLPYYSVAGLALFTCSIILPGLPWLSLFLPFFIAALPDIYEHVSERLPFSGHSSNLLAHPAELNLKDLDLILVAHIDTARAIPFAGPSLYRLRIQAFGILQRMALILALLGLLYLIDLPVGPAIYAAAISVTFLTGFGLLALDLWMQLGTHQRFVPGANDNASGVGVLLTLAEALKESPPQRLNLGFLFTGAEEAGLYGARAFARLLRGSSAHPYIVSVDMVGAGNKLRIITETRSFRRVHTDSALNDWLERADHSAVRYSAVRRSGDFAAFARLGLPASGIESNGTREFWRSYHTLEDDVQLLQPAMLNSTVEALARLVNLLDRNKPEAGTSLSNPGSIQR